jgi:hypothetical protein
MSWDKELSAKLRSIGVKDQDAIGAIIGIFAEERQMCDRQGYIRGYNNGWENNKILESNKRMLCMATNDPFS